MIPEFFRICAALPVFLGQGQQQVLAGDVLILHLFGFGLGLLQQLVQGVGKIGLGGSAVNLGKVLDLGLHPVF